MMVSPLPVHRASWEMEDRIPNTSLAIQFTCFRVYLQNLLLPLHKLKFPLMPVTTQCSSSQHPILSILCSQICRANLSVARSLPQTSLPCCWSISQRLNKNWKSIKGTIPISFYTSLQCLPRDYHNQRGQYPVSLNCQSGFRKPGQTTKHLGTLKL